MSDPRRRRAAATTATGAGLVAAGGHLRHTGVERAVRSSGQPHPPIRAAALIRNAPGRRLYATGVGAGLSGATAFGVGLHELTRRKNVEKTDGHRLDPVDFVSQGVSGTADAVRARAEGSRDRSTSPRAKAAVAAAGLASGAAGSHLTSRAIRRIRHGHRLAPALTALGGTAAGVASLPLTNRIASRRGYEVTATGVRRKKTPPVRPTRSATVVETRAGRGAAPNVRQQLVPSDTRFGKAEDYPGAGLTPRQKRARVIAAGATPLVGPYAAAAEAGRLAPPDQRRSAAALQYGGYAAGGLTGAALGSQAASRAAQRSPTVAEGFRHYHQQINNARSKAAGFVPGKLGRAVQRRVDPARGPGRVGRAVHRMAEQPGAVGRLARPIAEHPAAAAVGGLSGKAIGAAAGAALGYSTALRRERLRSAKMNSVDKAVANSTGMTRREQREQIRRKKRNLGLSMVSTTVGGTGAGLLAAREIGPRLPRIGPSVARHAPRLERAGLGTALVGGGIGAIQGAQSARIQRRDLAAQEKVYGVAKAGPRLVRTAGLRSSYLRRTPRGTVRVAQSVSKIDTTMDPPTAQSVVHQYGLKGPLPRNLDRKERMRAYEGRYVAAGGPKGERWQHRADNLDHLTGGALAIGGGAALTELAAHKHPPRPKLAGKANKIGLTAAGVGALSELAHRHAQHRASSYKNSPAGVAAGALRRMRDYSPDGD